MQGVFAFMLFTKKQMDSPSWEHIFIVAASARMPFNDNAIDESCSLEDDASLEPIVVIAPGTQPPPMTASFRCIPASTSSSFVVGKEIYLGKQRENRREI